jgi:hypothetical protein
MITSYQQTRLGNTTTITVTTDLAGVVWFHWYVDGIYQATTQAPSYTVLVPDDAQARIDVIDTTDPAFDPRAYTVDGWPARRTLWWVRSLSTVEYYAVQQQKDGGDWTTIGHVWSIENQWAYWLTTARLDDLADYAWRVVPVDAAGNEGDPLELGPEHVVRTPDAPRFAVTFDPATSRVTFSSN